MNIPSVKLELFEWLLSLKDENMLSTLQSFKNSTSSNDWFLDLTEKQKKNIEEGLIDIERGNVISSKDFWKNYDNYL